MRLSVDLPDADFKQEVFEKLGDVFGYSSGGSLVSFGAAVLLDKVDKSRSIVSYFFERSTSFGSGFGIFLATFGFGIFDHCLYWFLSFNLDKVPILEETSVVVFVLFDYLRSPIGCRWSWGEPVIFYFEVVTSFVLYVKLDLEVDIIAWNRAVVFLDLFKTK